MTGGSALIQTIKTNSMNASTKVVKLSDKVYQILSEKGFSKLFSWDEYVYFRKETAGQPEQAKKIADLFIFWNSHEVSDFADYEF